ncbi:uracil-DNA glycosylase family protein [Cupriavidus sp. SW-Y-13]|uniref:uracil-DNA glycosylase n=1 Tax=Cupriavidus sp. SW-Y-13 TaxID=2653854 RepID=UPI0013661AF7|nr:uracil-DNA glycosylase [Cupriavidus sp. SW-Y-13]MWL87515.1 uracil-DNA glycosylase [Cupriavidus sp. SW-Y-13]
MTRRALFLEALGIPVEWVPRNAVSATEADSETVVEADVARVEPPPEVVVREAVAITAASDVARDAVLDAPVDTAPEPADLAETIEAFDAPGEAAPRPVRQPSADPQAQTDREAAIATMDWPALADSIAKCTACGLCNTRTNTVFGVGDQQAEWMFVGEAPGENEDLQGEPFVGQAGKLLDNMLGALGLARGRNVYIANVLKCRPPGNRNPEPEEVALCEPHLKRQIALIKPKVIVVLGRFAAQTLLRSDTPIGKLRNTVYAYEGIPVVVTYHPAYLLRTLTDKARAWEDLCLAREVHHRAGAQA